MRVALLVVALLAGCSQSPPPDPEIHVIRGKCDPGLGALTGLDVAVSGPGTFRLEWDNAANCGSRS